MTEHVPATGPARLIIVGKPELLANAQVLYPSVHHKITTGPIRYENIPHLVSPSDAEDTLYIAGVADPFGLGMQQRRDLERLLKRFADVRGFFDGGYDVHTGIDTRLVPAVIKEHGALLPFYRRVA